MPSEPSKTKSRPPTEANDPAGEPSNPVGGASFPIVGIGASAGGLEAFTELLQHLPLDTGMGYVLVQHLDPVHESALTHLLARATSLPVREVTNNLRVEANHVYIIPPNTNLSITQGVLKLQPRPQGRTPHRSVDFFFESLAEDQRERAIGVILSGTASDGTLGLEAIKAEGGITFAQDDSARYDSMPRSAVAAGCVDFVLSPANIAQELARIAKHPYVGWEPAKPSSPEDDRAAATAQEDTDAPLPSGGRGTPGTGARKARAEAVAAGVRRRKSRLARGAEKSGRLLTPAATADNDFKKILLLLRNHSGVDFSLYKSTTIHRRFARRMVLSRQNSLDEYATSLKGNAKELDALYSDVLISVTSFFRNPEAFDILKRKVYPKLLQQRGDDPLRVWVLGCSTGQEAYSIAMAFVEAAEKAPRLRKLQVFATDLNDALLDKARHGLYARSLAQDVSPERLRRFFVEEEGGYRITKSLREMVVFARQNLISDPPFSRMDLISCRNLLIYLEPSLQKKIFPVFHYALKPGGFLCLGASESIGSFTELFEPVDKKHRIYSKKAAATQALELPVRHARSEQHSPGRSRKSGGALPIEARQGGPEEGFRAELNAQREADRIAVNQFAPPGVLINAELQVLQFRGPTGAYFEPPRGKASFDVLKMAREGLMLPLRAAINKAKKENKAARKEAVQLRQNGTTRTVNLEVIPLKNLRERCFLIVFEEATATSGGRASTRAALDSRAEKRAVAGRGARLPSKKEESRRSTELETELAETRDYLQSIQEQHEAANEELQASNEEVQSANEELQSINEELETSKEELESANEELTTVNEEMANRNTELNRLNSDLVNVQTSAHLAIVLLGRDLTIRRFSAQAEKQFNLLVTDKGRPFSQVRHNLVFEERRRQAAHESAFLRRPETERRQPDLQARGSATRAPEAIGSPPALESFIAEVIASVRERQREVRDNEGRSYSLRVRPYFTLDNKVDGAVLVLIDINELKVKEQAIAAARDYAENTIETVREPLLVLDSEMRVESANKSFYRTFQVVAAATVGKPIFELGNHQWDLPQLRALLADILPQKSSVEDFQVEHDFEKLGRRTMLLNARLIPDPWRDTQRILVAIEDVTERKRAEEARARLAAIVESSEDAIVGKDLNGMITSWNRGAERLFGYTAQEAVGQPVMMLIPPERGDEEPFILERIRRGEAVEHYETVRQRKDGTQFDISLTVSPVRNDLGQIVGASKVARDISQRKQHEQELQRAHELAEAIVRSVRDPLLILSAELRVRTANEAFYSTFKISAAETEGRLIFDLDNGAWNISRLRQRLADILPRNSSFDNFEVTQNFKRLGPRTMLLNARALQHHGEDSAILVGIQDVTELLVFQAEVRRSEIRYRRLFEAAHDGVLIIDPATRKIVDANPFMTELLGYAHGELLGKELFEIGLFRDQEASRAAFRELREKGFIRDDDLPLETKTGERREVEMVSNLYVEAGEKVIQCNIRDISERKEAEEASRRSEERYRTLVSVITDVPWTTDAEGQFTTPQPAWAAYTGQTWEESRGFGWANALHADDRAQIQETWRRACERRSLYESRGRFWHAVTQQYRYFEARATPLLNPDGSVREWVGTCTDVHERKRAVDALEEQAQLLDLSFDAIFVRDPQDRITYWSHGAAQAYGFPADEALGHVSHDLLQTQFPEPREKIFATFTRTGRWEGELVHTCKNGQQVTDLSRWAVGGERRYVLEINTNITERKQGEEALRKSEERFRMLFDLGPVAVYSCDASGVIREFNRQAAELWGRAPKPGDTDERFCGSFKMFRPDGTYMPHDRCPMAEVLTGAIPFVQEGEVHIERPDGSRVVVIVAIRPFKNRQGEITGAVNCFYDITERKQGEEALRKSEERFAQFMRHLPGLAWIKDAEGRYVYANDAAERVFGPRRAELYGKTDQELFPPETAAQFTQNDQQALASGSGIQTIETLAHADSVVHHSIVSKFPVPDPDGKEMMVGGVAFDITEQKEAEEALRESEERFRLLADTAPVLIWVNGLEGCEFVNREYLQFVGRTMEEVEGMNWATAVHPEDAQAYLGAYLQAVEERTPFEAQLRLRREDGEYRWMKSAGLPRFAADGRFLGYLGCSLDITDVKQSEEALAEADRHKNEFLAMLAHELRNPLAPIRNALEILRLTEGNREAVQSASEMMERQIGQMVRLVDDLLDVSRISRGRIELRKGSIELASALNHAAEAARPLLESKGLELTVTLPPPTVYLNGDPIRLAQVVGNLLNNAGKFTDKGGRIWLTAQVVTSVTNSDDCRVTSDEKKEPSDGALAAQHSAHATQRSPLGTPYAIIRVRDTGIGIASDQLPRIFEMFTQVDTSLERTRSGLGIGLTLAKKLVELHGGTLEVHSAGAGQGSEFVVCLPVMVETPEVQPPEPTVSEPATPKPRRILVVDDNLDSAESLTVLLELTGNETHAAYDGVEALEAAETFRPEVVLLDIGLPELNGYEVARKIREQPWGEKMVLVALTGYAQEEDRRRSREAGFNHHLTKPVDPVALMKLLAESTYVRGAS